MAGVIFAVSHAAAAPTEPPLLLGGPVAEAPHVVETDPRLPTGARIEVAPRPRATGRACSPRAPVCVHGSADVSAAVVLEALGALEHAYRSL
ncbi:MAG TPA: hypothetical protein VFV94_21300, partial [Polyangiaceae bacterium]|nr:hypothetical protein [Polyangiaceae bacterium]